nr:hypothetical protein [Tanacetum cinerariifolium]
MSEKDQTVDIMALPKFDMPSHESSMSAKDIKSLALRQETFSWLKGWKKSFFFLDRRAIPDVMAWRHHDSYINDPVLKDGFCVQDVETLAERVIDLRPIPSGLLFERGLATMWDSLAFALFSRILREMSYHREGQRPYQQDLKEQHTIHPLLADQAIPNKTGHQKEVEVADPKIVATRERKARADAMKIEKKKRDPNGGATANIAESQGNQSLYDSHHDSANHSVHEDQTIRNLTLVPTEVLQSSSSDHSVHRAHADEGESSRDQAYYVPEWFIHRRCRVDNPMWCRELMIHLAPPAAQEESNALENSNALKRAWFALGQGALAQADIIKRFKNLQTDYNSLTKTHAECGDTVRQLLEARETSQQSLRLYLEMSEWFKKLKNDHASCTKQVQLLKGQISELSHVNKDQALKIKEFDDTLARKDSALVHAERINAERDHEKERLVAQLSKLESKKFDCIRKLFPTVVERLFQSHEYKQSLSEPFNLAIQVGWGKGITEERSEEELLGLMSRMENLMLMLIKRCVSSMTSCLRNNILLWRKFLKVFRYTVSDLLKVYPDSPPSGQAPPSKSSSGKAPSSFAPRKT